MKNLLTILILQCLTLIPNFSETAFSPVLVSLQQSWHVSIELAELSFSLYLLGMALGLLYWGMVADRKLHKPLLSRGLTLYFISCVMCWQSPSIYYFLCARFCQGFAAVIASVMTLVIVRKMFSKTDERARVHSYIGMSLSVSPALGPLFGMHFAQSQAWQSLFIYLGFIVIAIALIAYMILPETGKRKDSKISIGVSLEVLKDKNLLFYASIAGFAIANAMVFFTLSPYYYEVIYHLSTTQFTSLFVCIAMSWVVGSFYAQGLIRKFGSTNTIRIGCYGANICSCFGVALTYFEQSLGNLMIPLSIAAICMTMVHTGTVIPNCISMALSKQNKHIGVASSYMGFTYNFVAAVITSIASLGPQANPHYFHLVFLIINSIAVLLLTYYTSEYKLKRVYENA